MKINTKKIKLIGSTLLLANMITGVFAAPTNVFTTIDAANYYNLPQVTMGGGAVEQTSTIPHIQLSGGQAQDTYTLTPVGFSGGQDEIISQISQITIGGGVDYVDFDFTQVQMGSDQDGIVDEYFEFDSTLELAGGVDASERNLGDGIFQGKQIETSATTTITIPSGMDLVLLPGGNSAYDSILNIDGVEIDLSNSGTILSLTTQEIAVKIASTTFPNYDVSSSSSNVIFTQKVTGLSGNIALSASDLGYSFTYTESLNSNLGQIIGVGSGSTIQAPQFSGGQDEIMPFTTIEVNGLLPQNSDDRTLNILGVPIDLGTLAQSKNDIKTNILNSISSQLNSLNLVVSDGVGSDIILTASNIDDFNNGDVLTMGDKIYFSSNAKFAKLTLKIDEDMPTLADDKLIQFDNVEVNLGTTNKSNEDIISIIHGKNYLTYNTLKEGLDKIIFVAKSSGIGANGDMPIHNTNFQYSTVNGQNAKASFTVDHAMPAMSQDKTITVLGVDIDLGDSALTQTQIANKIVTQVNADSQTTYTLSNNNSPVVSITNNNYVVDEMDIFGTDNNYATTNGVQASSNVVQIPSGIQTMSEDDLDIIIAGKTITLNAGSTDAEIATLLEGSFNSQTDTYRVEISNLNEIKFISNTFDETQNNNNLIVGNDDGKYNSKDNKAASLE
ncbi:MAG: hypothetical protein HRU03_06250, partial [Nanoarchaeales archaeon]|nr:hypothetical protein [Nanoarchaeales archaeon]